MRPGQAKTLAVVTGAYGRHRGGRRLPHLDSAGYITGCDLHVDGGTVAARLHRARLSS